ncbi:MAG: DUF928 domain-containing protein [Acaryochloris sp. CRU_2_0]|nr:DUF928 domain-containing protein [Acaryochloris sp. CRU_2_0]
MLEWTRIRKNTLIIGFVLFSVEVVGIPQRLEPAGWASVPSQSQGISWSQIFNWLRHRKVKGGSRDPSFCAITPVSLLNRVSQPEPSPVATVWNLQPLLAWKGSAEHIEVRQKDNDHLVWKATLTAKDQHINYQGKALQPGQTYVWRLRSRVNSKFPVIHSASTFQVMTDTERQQVKMDLIRLKSRYNPRNTSTEKLALLRANYFAQHQLWSDTLREALRVKQPSPQLAQLLLAFFTETCKTNNEMRSG